MPKETGYLERLAAAHGIQTSFSDWQGEARRASHEALISTLRVLGVGVGSPADASKLLREADRASEAEGLPPVVVAWNGRLRFRKPLPKGARCTLRTENGDEASWIAREDDPAPTTLPLGRLTLNVRKGRSRSECVILSAQRRLPRVEGRKLGVFAPVYALHSRHSWGVGDLRDLQELARWGVGCGARVIGTLPMLATFLERRRFDPSPYAPVSRLFWNELYIDVPGAASALGVAANAVNAPAGAEGAREIDYLRAMTVKRSALERLANAALKQEACRSEFESFLRARPETSEYARFRAFAEAREGAWQTWPDSARNGRIDGAAREAVRYHEFVQFVFDRQLRSLRDSGAELYLDMPIGVHAGGYDTWRYRDAFVHGVSVGAPPDSLFHGGQNWGVPPPHPEASRRDGHAYFASCLRNHFANCKLLRLDHVMGLFRLFWVPPGMDAKDGVYVRYPMEELLAVLSIEAHRSGAGVIGENLGTVPEEVNRAMDRHGMLRMYVGQFEMRPDERKPMGRAPAGHLASLNTHDTPTFTGFVSGKEIDLRVKLGILDRKAAAGERAARDQLREAILRYASRRTRGKADVATALRVLLKDLAASDAEIVLISLEDLWLEQRPQNVPGISSGYPLWRRRMARRLERIVDSAELRSLLEELERERRSKKKPQQPVRRRAR